MADTRHRVGGMLVDSCPAAPVHHGPHTHTQDGTALHCPGHPAPPPEQLAGAQPTASTITDDQLDALRADLEQLRSALDWQTSCLSCARVLESSYAETARAERAEQQLANVRAVFDRARGSRWAGMAWGPELAAALDSGEQPSTDGVPQHAARGTNAEDCPACSGTNPPYPWLCPGPAATPTTGRTTP